MAVYGPDMAPRTANHELEVLDVHVARNAQRRLAENARAARDENATLLELEEHCLEDPPVADATQRLSVNHSYTSSDLHGTTRSVGYELSSSKGPGLIHISFTFTFDV